MTEEFKMTTDEMQRFQESLKNPEFKSLFFDYMNEISDPKNKELYEKELAELEKEKGYNVRYIKPEACFVVKSNVYINICSSPEIASCTNNNSNWSIPYSLSKPRQEAKKLKTFDVYDCVFHPSTIEKCSSEKFKQLVVSVAMEGIEKQFNVTIKRDFKYLKGKKSEGTPMMTMIKEKDSSLPVVEETSLDYLNSLEKQNANNIEIPKFKIIHQQKYEDYQKFTGERVKTNTSRPDGLVIRIDLPKIDSAKDVDVDIQDNLLDLQVPKLYKLTLSLPFPVFGDKAEAKFDKTKRVLSISVPVEPAKVEELETVAVAAESETIDNLDKISKEEEIEVSETVDNGLIQEVIEETVISDAIAVPENVANEIALVSQLDSLELNQDTGQETEAMVDNLQNLQIRTPEIEEIFVVPKFHAHQNEFTASFIIDVEKVNPSSVVLNSAVQTTSITFSDENKNYKLELEFETELEDVKFDVGKSNVCLVVKKKQAIVWSHVTVIENEISNILTFPSLKNFPTLTPSVVTEVTPMKVSAKQKPDTVVIEATKATVKVESIDKVETKFVNNLLFDLD